MRCRRVQHALGSAALLVIASCTGSAGAHALAGQRLFPSTLTFDDPGIGAELPLVFSHIRADGTTVDVLGAAITKPVTGGFSLTAETGYLASTTDAGPAARGWENLTLGAVWQVYRNAATESIGSFSINRSFAHTGSRAVRDGFATWSPEFDFGQGLGGVRAAWLRPFAITGALALDLPDTRMQPRMLDWALSLQYSIPYLQNSVRYAGIPAPFSRLFPIIELPMQTCLDRGCRGQTTGYLAPGFIWIGRHVQWGAELQVPVNHRTGNSVGIMLGLDLYLDDLAPHGFGAPLFR